MTIDARDFRFELIGKPHERRSLRLIGRSKRRTQVIQREVNVVQRITNLVRDRGGQTTNYSALLCLMELKLEFASASEFGGHLVERRCERAHLVPAFGVNLNLEVPAGD